MDWSNSGHESPSGSLEGCLENEQMAISLMSQFCDSRLKEMSTITKNIVKSGSEIGTYSDVDSSSPTSLYSDILSSHHDSNSEQISSSGESNPSFTDLSEISIKRKLHLTRHVKSINMQEWSKLSTSHDTNRSTTSWVKERLESYLPILQGRVKNGKWAKLKQVDNLESLLSGCPKHNTFDTESNSVHNQHCWDSEQAVHFTMNDNKVPRVYYGVIDKPNSVKPQRLKKLFDSIGVNSLPLQSMTMTALDHKKLYLMDGTARVKLFDLSGNLKYREVVTGVIVAVIGRLTSGGFLQAEDVLFPTPIPPEWPLPIHPETNVEMVFVSGLNLESGLGSPLALDLLQDYLMAISGSAYEQQEILSSRMKLFVIGNMINKNIRETTTSSDTEKLTEKYMKAVEKLDRFLEPLTKAMEVFLIPGDNDMTLTSNLPQPPIHLKTLRVSGRQPSLKRLPNPARIHVSVSAPTDSDIRSEPEHTQQPEVAQPPPSTSSASQSSSASFDCSYADFLTEDIHLLDISFQSGRNVKQTMDYCDISCPIEMTKQLLKWGHLHPTSSCDSNSVLARDTFRLQGSLPHIVAIGNLSAFKSENWNETKIIGIPAFYSSHTAVIFTKDFNVLPISFKLIS